MKRHAKAPSAGSTSGIGSSRGLFGRALATRGAHSDANGSGAPSGRLFALVLAIASALILIAAPGAQAAKNVIASFGSTSASPALGGTFAAATGVGGSAVYNATGDVYVVDRGNNRVQQFSASGAFIRAWGTDVVATGAGNANEMQAVAVAATGGQFRLNFGAGGPGVSETADLAFDATAAQVQSALNALTNISTGGGSVTVSGGPGDAGANAPYLINFNGAPLAGTNVAAMTGVAGTTPLSGGTGSGANAATVTTFAEGGGAGTAFEICEVAANCKAGTTAATGGGMSTPQGIAVNQVTGNVYVTDGTLLRVDEFDAKGNFIRAFGQDVVSSGPHNNATAFEICSAADVCKTGVSASTAGAIKSSFTGYPAIAPAGAPNAGNVVVADPGNLRVNEYGAAGASVRSFGWGVLNGAAALQVCTSSCQAGISGSAVGQFGGGGPTRVAVESSGQTYALDNGNARLLKFNTPGTSATVFAPALVSGTLSGFSFTAAPSEVAVDPANDNVYVVKASAAPSESRVLQFDGYASLLESHVVGAGITTVNGLSLASSTAAAGAGNIYLSTTNGQQQILVLNTGSQTPPTATIDPGSGFAPTATTATLTGAVNPAGFSTGWHFEYSVDGVKWTKAPAADTTLGFTDSSPHAVSQVVSGLTASTLYHARLVATKAFAAGTATSSETTFTTQAAAPVITAVNPDEVGNTTVTLTARIDPSNQATTYHFEYGSADCASNLCTSVPVPSATLAAGAGNTFVSQAVTGLNGSTTYHFRVVAVNATGETDGVDRTFTTAAVPAASPQGPSGYELVSPASSDNYNVINSAGSGPAGFAAEAKQVTKDGKCLAYALKSTLPGMAIDGESTDFILGCRTASGWTATAPAGDRTTCSYNGSTNSAGLNSEVIHDIAEDGSQTLISVGACWQSRQLLSGGLDQNLQTSAAPNSQSIFSNKTDGDVVSYLSGAYDANGPIPRADNSSNLYLGGSADLESIYFITTAGLLPGVPSASVAYVYRRAGGVTTLVSKTPAGTPLGASVTGAGSSQALIPGTVTTDGSAVTFATTGAMDNADANGLKDVYQARGAQVVWASKSAFTGTPQTSVEKIFEGASSDGRRIYLSTKEKLIGNGTSTGDLDTVQDIYAYDEDAPPGQELSRVSVADPSCGGTCNDNLSNTTTAGNDKTSTAKFVTLSADGNMAFFTSGDVLSAADTDNQQSLYVHNLTTGATTYIARVGAGSPTNDNNGTDVGLTTVGSLTNANAVRPARQIRVSPDGTVAAFQLTTENSLPAGRGGEDTDGARDLFVWSQAGGLRRVRQGFAPDDNTGTVPQAGCGFAAAFHCAPVSSDGSLVYFQTSDSLVPGDIDGGAVDVYAVDARTGKVIMVSPTGSAPFNAEYLFSSASGSDVFFTTREAIDPSRDRDSNNLDVYDARTGVSVFGPLAGSPDCEGDACQGAPAPPSAASPPASANFAGPGNPVPVHKAKPKKSKKKKQHKKNSNKRTANNDRRNGR